MDESVQKHIEESLPKVGRYQHLADALLIGCARTRPITGRLMDHKGGACAVGAIYVGLDSMSADGSGLCTMDHETTTKMEKDYLARYGYYPTSDNDTGRYTREEIAARIAAL